MRAAPQRGPPFFLGPWRRRALALGRRRLRAQLCRAPDQHLLILPAHREPGFVDLGKGARGGTRPRRLIPPLGDQRLDRLRYGIVADAAAGRHRLSELREDGDGRDWAVADLRLQTVVVSRIG